MPSVDGKSKNQSWADRMDDHVASDYRDMESALPPIEETIDGDKKIVTEYRRNDDGKKVKVTRYFRIERRKVPKSIATRKNWAKFGRAAGDSAGPNPANTLVADDVYIQFISNKDDDHLDASRGGTGQGEKAPPAANKSTVKCRYCEQDHWSTKCPYKDKLELLPTMKEKAAAEAAAAGIAPGIPEESSAGGSKYVPPSKRAGGNVRGDLMSNAKSKDEANTLRVTNLPEEISDSDIRELFKPFGRIVRIFLAKDKYTGVSKGFAFVSFENRMDAQKAIHTLNGYGYSNLILNVEWSKPSTTA